MPSEPAKAKAGSPIKAIQEAIRSKMYNSDDPSDTAKVFITEYNLELAWRDHDLITIFPSSKFTKENRDNIRARFIRVLSILILIGWSNEDLLTKFRSQFLRATGREDKDLPLAEENLAFLDTSTFVFWQQQFAFCPAIVEESDYSHIQEIEKDKRLPFSGKPVQVGDGAYGTVSKVVIAPRCLRHIDRETQNTQVVLEKSSDLKTILTRLTAHESRL